MIAWKNPLVTFTIGVTIGTALFFIGSKSNQATIVKSNILNYVQQALKDNRYTPAPPSPNFVKHEEEPQEEDLDSKLLKSSDKSEITADELAKKVKVLCFIVTTPKHHWIRAIHVKKTWGRRCNKLIFMSTKADYILGSVKLNVTEGYKYLWAKSKRSLEYIYQKHLDEYDWFLKADDDTYVIMENLRNLLKDYDTDEAHYFGCNFKLAPKITYMSGGAGYVLSRKAVVKFVEEAIPDPKKCSQKDEGYEDMEMGKCLQNIGVEVDDSRDVFGKHRFLALPPTNYLVPGTMSKNFWWWKYIRFPQKAGMQCCSNTGISYHYITPNNMYLFEFFLYQLRVIGVNKTEVQDTRTSETTEIALSSTSQDPADGTSESDQPELPEPTSTIISTSTISEYPELEPVADNSSNTSTAISTKNEPILTTTSAPKPKTKGRNKTKKPKVKQNQ